MSLDFSVLARIEHALLLGLMTTLQLTAVCIVVGCTLGFLVGRHEPPFDAMERSTSRPAKSTIQRSVPPASRDGFRWVRRANIRPFLTTSAWTC